MLKQNVLLIAAISLGMAIPVASADDIVSASKKSLEMWEPNSIIFADGKLVVHAKEARMTEDIYTSMIQSGLCFGMLIRPDGLAGVKEISILNKLGVQGYVFEGGASECKEINNIPATKVKQYILGKTHLH